VARRAGGERGQAHSPGGGRLKSFPRGVQNVLLYRT
jgi:hypothetical protein